MLPYIHVKKMSGPCILNAREGATIKIPISIINL